MYLATYRYRYIGCCAVLRYVVKQYQSSFVSFCCKKESCCSKLKEIPLKDKQEDNKRLVIVGVDTGGCCRGWREWELIKRLDTPRGGDFCVSVVLHDVSSQRALSCFLVRGTSNAVM